MSEQGSFGRERLQSAFRKGVKKGQRLDRDVVLEFRRRIERLEKIVAFMAPDHALLRGEGVAQPFGVLREGSKTESTGTGGGE